MTRPVDAKPRFQIRNPLLRQEFPWLVSEVVLLLILFNANPPELWFWLVVLGCRPFKVGWRGCC